MLLTHPYLTRGCRRLTIFLMKTSYPIRVVTEKGNHFFPAIDADDNDRNPVDDMLALGYEIAGENRTRSQRAELRGAPRFKGLVGPMWDGDALRYEDSKTNHQLSI